MEPFLEDDQAHELKVRAMQSALGIQVGGSHYKNLKIQPIEFCHANKLGPCESAVVKYISRWKDKNGIEDLHKVKHYVDLLIELEGLTVTKNQFQLKKDCSNG